MHIHGVITSGGKSRADSCTLMRVMAAFFATCAAVTNVRLLIYVPTRKPDAIPWCPACLQRRHKSLAIDTLVLLRLVQGEEESSLRIDS